MKALIYCVTGISVLNFTFGPKPSVSWTTYIHIILYSKVK